MLLMVRRTALVNLPDEIVWMRSDFDDLIRVSIEASIVQVGLVQIDISLTTDLKIMDYHHSKVRCILPK